MKKTNSRILLLSFAAALTAGAVPASASDAVMAPVRYLPPPVYCNHLPCPGDSGDDTEKPRFEILRGMSQKVSKLAGNIENHDMTAAAASLGGIFAGGSAGAEVPVVMLSAPQRNIQAVRPGLLKKGKGRGAFAPMGWKGCAAGALASGASGCGIGSAAEDGFNEIIDRIGDHLRG